MKVHLLTLLFVAAGLLACEKEPFQKSPVVEEDSIQALVVGGDEEGTEEEDKGEEDCFTLVYPLAVVMPDGTALSGEEETLWEAVKSWYEANPEAKDYPSLVYPVEIILNDGSAQTITNDDEMKLVKEECEVKEECFKLLYPVSWTMPDGTTAQMNGEEDWDAIKDWYEANPDTEEKPALNYPVTVEFLDGSTQPVADEDEMIGVKEEC